MPSKEWSDRFNVSSSQLGQGEIRVLFKPRLPQRGASEVRTLQLRALQACALQLRAPQVRALQLCASQLRALQLRAVSRSTM